MTLLVATRNVGKVRELRRLLASLPVSLVTPDEVGLSALPEEDGIETYDTFLANARAKAEYFHRRSGLRTVADDSGLEVVALGGAPGVWSKRFAGVDGPDEQVSAANIQHLLARLGDRPATERGAQFRCVLAVVGPGGESWSVEGTTEGRILDAIDGSEGFGYDPVFYSPELGRSFGRSSGEDKGRVSHRGRAAAALVRAWPTQTRSR